MNPIQTINKRRRIRKLRSDYNKSLQSLEHCPPKERFLFHLEIFGRGSSVITYVAKLNFDVEKLMAHDGFLQMHISKKYLKREPISYTEPSVALLFTSCMNVFDSFEYSTQKVTLERLELLSLGVIFLDRSIREKELVDSDLNLIIDNCLGGWASGVMPASIDDCMQRLEKENK